MNRTERKRLVKEDIKKDILDAALKILVNEGVQSVTIRKIADAIEYTPPIVYEYFESKDAIFKELMLSGFRTIYQRFGESCAGEQDPQKLLIKLSLIHWDFAVENKELYRLMFILDRPLVCEETIKGMSLMKEFFMKISGKNKDEVMLLIFNWTCLLNGTISTISNFEIQPEAIKFGIDPREIFINFIDRFISSIS
jgi:AcrR family transcriptional regulator